MNGWNVTRYDVNMFLWHRIETLIKMQLIDENEYLFDIQSNLFWEKKDKTIHKLIIHGLIKFSY